MAIEYYFDDASTFWFGSGAGHTTLFIDGAAGSYRDLRFNSAASLRWNIRIDNSAESGSDAGSDFMIRRYDDSGASIDTPVKITRSTGAITLDSALTTIGGSGDVIDLAGVWQINASGNLQCDGSPTAALAINIGPNCMQFVEYGGTPTVPANAVWLYAADDGGLTTLYAKFTDGTIVEVAQEAP